MFDQRDHKPASPARRAARIALVYFTVTAIYIILSDRFLLVLGLDAEAMADWQMAKGLGFMGLLSVALFLGLNWVFRRLEARQQEWLEADRRMMAGVMASSVAHDLNNLLTTALIELELQALERPDDPALRRIRASCEEMARLVKSLRDFGKEQIGQRLERRSLAALVRDSLDLARRHASLRQRELRVDIPETLEAQVPPGLFPRMLTNLVLNAAEASPPGGWVRVSAEPSADGVVLRVDDNGPGVPAAQREAIFEPFHTTKPEGSGLGLISVKAAVALLGGAIRVADAPEGGARFEIFLPRPGCVSG